MKKIQPLIAKSLLTLFFFAASNAIAQPKITGFSPASGPVGTVVIITGSGFNAVASGNIVYFGAVRAVVSAASATSLTVQVPAGATYQPLSVLNTANSLTGFSDRPFLPTFTNPFGSGIEDNFYKPRVEFSSGGGIPRELALADIDGDGKPDLIINSSGTVAVLRNTATSGTVSSAAFAAPVNFSTGIVSFTITDADGDGRLDIVTANSTENAVSVLRNTATPGVIDGTSFAAPVSFSTGTNPVSVTAGDIDGDGRPDIVSVNRSQNTLSVLRNQSAPGIIGAGSFAGKVDFTTNTQPGFVRLADIDGDGKPDVVVGQNNFTSGLAILRNTAVAGNINASSLAPRVDYNVGGSVQQLAIGDLNGDGKPDIVLPSSRVLSSTAITGVIDASSFAAPFRLDEDRSVYDASGPVAIGDADGDGRPDIAASAGTGTSLAVFRNLSAGGSLTAASFAFRVDFSTSNQSFSSSSSPVLFGDIDGDGSTELISAYQNFQTPASSRLLVFQIGTPPPASPAAPSITGFSPLSGPVGSTVIITGANFNPTPANNIVSFGNVKAVVTAATSNSVTVTVPPGTTYKPIAVLNTATGLTALTATPFTTTFANPFGTGIPSNYYQPPVGFGTDYAPASVAVGDLDGDGKPEIVVGNYTNVSVLRNTSTPGSITPYSFATKVSVGGGIVNLVSIADINGDGKPDIISVHGSNSNNYLSVIPNTSTPGNLSFGSSKDVFTGSDPSRAAIGDLDGDGKPDIVVANSGANTLSVLRNMSTPDNLSFASKVDISINTPPAPPILTSNSVIISDLNGDGKPDLAVTIPNYPLVTLLLNKAVAGSLTAASFAPGVNITTGNSPGGLEATDLNGDGKTDLVLSTSGSLSVLQNNTADGYNGFSFSGPINLAASGSPVEVADVDGDGRPDLVARSSSTLSVLRNLMTGGSLTPASFAPKVDFDAGPSTSSLTTGDLDGDGIPELVVTNIGAGSASVLRINAAAGAGPAPRISSFSPGSGPVGATVTITGTNFNPISFNNIVYFGATRAVVSGGSATSLTVTVPAGTTYEPISVLNSGNGLTGYSQQPFAIIFRYISPVTSGFYRPKVDFATGAVPFFAAFSDLDGDGKSDLVTANAAAGTISLLRNTGTSRLNMTTFGLRVDLPVGGDPRHVATGDLDGDGKPDLVVANAGSGTLSVMRNSSIPGVLEASSFSSRTDLAIGANPYSVAMGDVDGDGKPDLVATNFQNGTVSVLRNLSITGTLNAASFAAPVNYPAGAYPRFVIVRDLNGDGKPEIAVVNEQANTVSVLYNTAVAGMLNASSLAAPVSFATGASPDCLAAADFDSDGKLDLAVSNFGSNTVSVLRNVASGTTIDASSFAAKKDYATGSQPFFVAAGDADGDGKADIVVANAASPSLTLLHNASISGNSPGFDAGVAFAAGGYPVCIALADADGDNIPELVSANAGSNTVSLLPVNNPRLPPVITAFSPAGGGVNTQVTITGANFDPDAYDNDVYFGAVRATVLSGSTTNLTVKVPAGATYQPLSVGVNGLSAYSSRPFELTFPNPFGTGIPGNFYKPKTDFAISNPFLFAVAFGDLNGDGKPDMVGVNKNTGLVSVMRNISVNGSLDASSFSAPVNFATDAHPQDVKLLDVDGDGRLEIVTVNPEDYSFSIFRNNISSGDFSTYSFLGATTISTGNYFSSLALGDLDRDGNPDVVVTNLYSGTISVLRNITLPSNNGYIFASKVDFPAGDYPQAVAIGDVDGDGRPDIVVGNERSNSISVFHSQTEAYIITPASFAARVDFAVGNSPSGVALGDVDGDGRLDVAVSNYASNNISVLRNAGISGSITATSLDAKVDFATGSGPYAIAMGDADGDGKTDLVTANTADNTISVLRNTSASGGITAASFTGRVDFSTSGYPLSLALGDLDGDGLAEAAAANAATGTISVFKINSPAAMTAAVAPGVGRATAEQAATGVQLYPNPTRGAFTLQLLNMRGQAVNVEVLDESGKAVEKKVLNTAGGTARFHFSMRGQPAGAYYVKVTGIEGIQVIKVFVQR